MDRRKFNKLLLLSSATAALSTSVVLAEDNIYMSIEQAKKLLWADTPMTKIALTLTDEQVELIEDASDSNVRNNNLQLWKTEKGGWFIVDQIIGKHENIDIAFAYTSEGKVKGFEILRYVETYGYEVNHPKWRAQFHGKDHSELLELDEQIKNISGATLSCKHITDGINRLSQTWFLVLKDL
ncbi:MAG: FMN-binding protein [Methylococcales symbiont of Hymedesmia sp. n. MRB-2018]|nr:MAG: FMN-binding protein [Methylococcales symbiont of Hymedesmia sp. n. MRB-2018]